MSYTNPPICIKIEPEGIAGPAPCLVKVTNAVPDARGVARMCYLVTVRNLIPEVGIRMRDAENVDENEDSEEILWFYAPPNHLRVSIVIKPFNCFDAMGRNVNKQSQTFSTNTFFSVMFYRHELLYLADSHIYGSRSRCLNMVKMKDENNSDLKYTGTASLTVRSTQTLNTAVRGT